MSNAQWRGDRCRERRVERGASLEDLAALPEIRKSRYTIERWEDQDDPSGPDYDEGMAISRFLDCHPNYLVGLTDNPGKYPVPKTARKG